MGRFIYILIAILFIVVLLFSYKVRDYQFSIVKDLKNPSQDQAISDDKMELVSKPIVFDAQRKFLTALYREKHTGDCDHEKKGMDSCLIIKPQIIVVHMTDLKDLDTSFEYMKEPVLREEREKLISRSYDRLNVSAHYLVDRDGSIYNLMPEYYMARHAIGVNHNSIGIENVGTNKEGPSQEQIESVKKLVTYLMKKYGIPLSNVYSHAGTKVLKESNNPLFVEKDTSYFEQKYCGEKILTAVKEGLSGEGY